MLGQEFTVDSWDAAAVKRAAIDLAHDYGVAESTARDYCKAFSKLLGVEHPVADPRAVMFAWFRDVAPTMELDDRKAAFKAYCGDASNFDDGKPRSSSNINEYWKGYELHLFLEA